MHTQYYDSASSLRFHNLTSFQLLLLLAMQLLPVQILLPATHCSSTQQMSQTRAGAHI
jgi:hypothetical protein